MGAAKQFEAFTVKFNGRASRIITDIKVFPAFDPERPPSPTPPHVSTSALWDTGATRSVISADVAKALSLSPVGAVNVSHAGGTSVSPTYMVNFLLPNNVGAVGILATQFPTGGDFSAIVGMDIMSHGDVAITNVSGLTCFSFRYPSCATVDYVADAKRLRFASVGRNDPCPCGSGKKYKKCHGT